MVILIIGLILLCVSVFIIWNALNAYRDSNSNLLTFISIAISFISVVVGVIGIFATVIGIIVSLGHTEILDKLPFDVLGNQSRQIVLPDGGAELTEHSGHHYCICTRGDIDSFRDAENFCERIGGHLAVINDIYENAFLYDTYFGPYPHKTNSAYFGYTCEKDGETWYWVDDSKSEYEGGYQNWKEGEPSCYDGKKEYYALFWHLDPDYTWNSGDFGKEPPEDGTVTFLIEWE